MDSKIFGQFIARSRKERNMTQADLAKEIGVTDKAVSRWERGIGFPDINTLEPLANALGISVLELMRSERMNMENQNNNLSEGEVTEIMANAVEMAKENRRQDKVSVWIGGFVTIVVAVLVKLSGHANIGGSLFVGVIVSLAAIGMYFFVRNEKDKESRKIYGSFMLAGIGAAILLLHLAGINSYMLVWGLFCILCFLIGIISKFQQ